MLRSSHEALRILYTYTQFYESAPADKKPRPEKAIKNLRVSHLLILTTFTYSFFLFTRILYRILIFFLQEIRAQYVALGNGVTQVYRKGRTSSSGSGAEANAKAERERQDTVVRRLRPLRARWTPPHYTSEDLYSSVSLSGPISGQETDTGSGSGEGTGSAAGAGAESRDLVWSKSDTEKKVLGELRAMLTNVRRYAILAGHKDSKPIATDKQATSVVFFYPDRFAILLQSTYFGYYFIIVC